MPPALLPTSAASSALLSATSRHGTRMRLCLSLCIALPLAVSLSLSPFLALTLTLARSSGTQPPYGLFVGFRVFGACGHTQVGSPPPPPPPPPPASALPATGRTRLYKAALLSHAWLRPPPDLPQFTAPPLFASLTGVASRQQILLRRSLSQLASLKCRLSFRLFLWRYHRKYILS